MTALSLAAVARTRTRPGGVPLLPVSWPAVGIALALAVLTPAPFRPIALLAAIAIGGIPHGALDVELARTRLRPHFPRAWFVLFSVPYLALAALVLAAWAAAPLVSLAVFLALSAVHFGTEDSGRTAPVPVLARGGLPIAMPILSHPHATATLLGLIAAHPLAAIPGPLLLAAVLWVPVAAIHALALARRGDREALALAGATALAALLLPPLAFFAIYFIGVHAPAHVRGLVADHLRAPRITSSRAAWRLSLAPTLLTFALAAVLWPLYAGPPAVRLTALVFQVLGALTVPHMLAEAALARLPAPRR